MAVRNFWLESFVDGRKTKLASGPRRADGGFRQRIYIRDGGGINQAMIIEGRVVHNYDTNEDFLELFATSGDQEIKVRTKR